MALASYMTAPVAMLVGTKQRPARWRASALLATFVGLRALAEPSHGCAREADAEQRERGGFGVGSRV